MGAFQIFGLGRPKNVLDPICLFGAYPPSTDEKGYAWPHGTRLLIEAN